MQTMRWHPRQQRQKLDHARWLDISRNRLGSNQARHYSLNIIQIGKMTQDSSSIASSSTALARNNVLSQTARSSRARPRFSTFSAIGVPLTSCHKSARGSIACKNTCNTDTAWSHHGTIFRHLSVQWMWYFPVWQQMKSTAIKWHLLSQRELHNSTFGNNFLNAWL